MRSLAVFPSVGYYVCACHDFQILNQFTDLHENLYDPHVTEGKPNVTYFSLLQLVITLCWIHEIVRWELLYTA
jgi:hypothetical protein